MSGSSSYIISGRSRQCTLLERLMQFFQGECSPCGGVKKGGELSRCISQEHCPTTRIS